MIRTLVLLLILTLDTASGAEPIEIIDLRHREAAEIIPLLQPFLSDTDAVTGTGFQLFIKAHPDTLQQIKPLIELLDRAPRSLIISVSNETDSTRTQKQIEGGVVLKDENSRVVVGRPTQSRSSELSASADYITDKNSGERHSRLRVTEGKPAFILREDLRVVPARTFIHGANGYQVIDHVTPVYSNQNGFYVTARIVDSDHVNVDITPVFGDEGDDIAHNRLQTATTTVRAPIGKWILIGGTSGQRQNQQSGILSRSKESSHEQSDIYLKIDVEQ